MQFPLTAEKESSRKDSGQKQQNPAIRMSLRIRSLFSARQSCGYKIRTMKKQTQTVQQAAANIEALRITRLQALQHRALFACKTGHSLYFPLHPQRYPSSPNSCFFKKLPIPFSVPQMFSHLH